MSNDLSDLYLERGRLVERIANQRITLAQHLRPLQDAEDKGRRLLTMWSDGMTYLKSTPWLVALVVVTVVIVKPRRILPWLLRGVTLWRGWKALRSAVPPELWAAFTQAARR